MTRTVALAVGLTVSVLAAILFSTRSSASPPGVKGTIMAVEAAEQRICVKDNEAEYWFQCTPNTNITLNGYAATFSQLAAGQTAMVKYDPTNSEALQVDAMQQR